MKRFGQILLGLAALGAATSAQAMPLGLRMALWNRSAREVRSYPVEVALGADATIMFLPWSVGTNGVASAKGRDDATAAGGRSVKFTAADDSSAWVETVVTNGCRVSFDWKSSCEPLVKGRPYDYLAFAVDGARVSLVCGETEWTNEICEVTGNGEHLLRWTFTRDEDGSVGEDCAWLANVKVMPVESETFGEYLNWPEQAFTTGGDAEWTRAKGVSADGYALRSGVISHSQTSRLDTVVSGPGTVTFSCKVAGEIVKKIVYDGLAFCIDGIRQGGLMGNEGWETKSFEVAGGGSHTLSWLYVKDEEGSAGEDCAWLGEVTWTPSGAAAGLESWLAERNLAAESRAENGRTAAECYALGLDPADATNDFRIVSIELTDDGPKVEWEPKTNRWTGAEIPAVLKGAASPEGPWAEVSAGGGSPGTARPAMQFFKVTVEMP